MTAARELGREIGRDPPSIDAAMIGGIAANHACGETYSDPIGAITDPTFNMRKYSAPRREGDLVRGFRSRGTRPLERVEVPAEVPESAAVTAFPGPDDARGVFAPQRVAFLQHAKPSPSRTLIYVIVPA
jgi:hypothetical protein